VRSQDLIEKLLRYNQESVICFSGYETSGVVEFIKLFKKGEYITDCDVYPLSKYLDDDDRCLVDIILLT
jgi:hypothetical protein